MINLKKGLAWLLSATMLLGSGISTLAAENNVAIEAEVSNTAPKVGDEFKVIVKLTKNEGFNANDFQLSYDDDVVQFLGFETKYDEDEEEDVLVSDCTSGMMISYNNKTAIVAMAKAKNTTKTGTLFTANFKALKAGNASIKSNDEKFNMTAGAGEAVNVTWNFSAAENLVIRDAVASDGYTVGLKQETQSKIAGETAEVTVQVEAKDLTEFNALYAKLSYDTSYLSLNTTSTADYTILDNNGSVEIIGYGTEKAVGDVVTLQFTVDKKPSEGTEIELVKASVDESKNAAVQDAPEASYGNNKSVITVSGLNVTIPEDDFNGSNTVESGKDYTFEAKNPNYNYTFNATMGEAIAEVIDNGDGTYTVKNVTDDLVIEIASKTAKTFNVTVKGALDNQVEADAKATYGTNYIFTVNKADGYNTKITMTIANKNYTAFVVSDSAYTILGEDITGDIEIQVTNTKSDYSATITGTGAGLVNGDEKLTHGEDYHFTIDKKPGYTYKISATMGGTDVEVIDNGDGSYTIKNVTGDLVITVDEFVVSGDLTVEVSEYLKLDGKTIYLVLASKENLEEGKSLAYDGNVMYWSDSYQTYAYLVVSSTALTAQDAANNITELSSVNAGTIDYSGDVNGTTAIDVNDAQLVYDMYNAKYDGFDTVSMLKFLNADLNGDKSVDATDAAAVVNLFAGK